MEINMIWAQIIVTVISAGLVGICSLILSSVRAKQKEAEQREQGRQEQERLVLNGVKALLRERIYDRAKTGLRIGFATIKDKELMEQTYLPYHELQGNSVATELYEQYMSLPINE